MAEQRDARLSSLMEYSKTCLATFKAHDWRHATDAPGWKLGDGCVRCQDCQLKAIFPVNAPESTAKP